MTWLPAPTVERTKASVASRGWAGCGPQPSIWWYFALGMAAAILRLVLALRTAPVDDAFIHLRYARSLIHGHGLVFQPGEPVFALSGPLYAAALAVPLALHGDPTTFLPFFGVLPDLLTLWLVNRMATRLSGRSFGFLAAAFYGLFPWQALACGHGMEAQLFSCLVFAAFTAGSEERWNLAAMAAGLATLTRPEGWLASLLLAFVAFTSHQGRRRRTGSARRVSLVPVLLWALCVLPWTTYMIAVYRSPVPTSIAAKSWRHVSPGTVLDYFVTGNPFLLLLWIAAAAGAVVCLRPEWAAIRPRRLTGPVDLTPSKRSISLLLCAGWALSYTLLFFIGRPSFLGPWYRPPVHAALSVLAAYGVSCLARPSGPAVLRPNSVAALTAAGWIFLCALALPRTIQTARFQRKMVVDIYQPVGRWVVAHSAPEDTVLAGDIGYLGYMTDRPVLDLGGLVTPSLGSYLRTLPAARRSGVEVALARRPRILVAPVRPEFAGDLADSTFLSVYELAGSFPPAEAPATTDGKAHWRELVYLRRDRTTTTSHRR
jgi:hypothetical protein